MKSPTVFGALVASLALFWALPALAQADLTAGRIVFNQKCAACHTLSPEPDHSTQGPNLMGVIGRTAGTIEGWDFSPALAASGLVWVEENLNDWLTDPAVLVPESSMNLKVPNRFEREDVIAYIRSVNP